MCFPSCDKVFVVVGIKNGTSNSPCLLHNVMSFSYPFSSFMVFVMLILMSMLEKIVKIALLNVCNSKQCSDEHIVRPSNIPLFPSNKRKKIGVPRCPNSVLEFQNIELAQIRHICHLGLPPWRLM